VRRRLKNGGFTLLEVLIALAIFSVMSMMAYGGLKTILNARNGTEQAAKRLNELQMAFLLIQQDMQHMAPRTVRVGYGREPAWLDEPELEYQIAFTRGGNSTPRRPGRSGLYRVAYQLEEEKLIRMIWPALDRVDGSVPQKMVLLQGVSSVDFDPDFDTENRSGSGFSQETQLGFQPDAQVGDILPKSVKMVLSLDDWGTITRLFAMPY